MELIFMRLRNISALLFCLAILAGCGQMGPLYLPPAKTAPVKNPDKTHLDTMIKST